MATDYDEAVSAGQVSGLNAALLISTNTFGGHDNAHADFQHIGLKFVTSVLIQCNYFTAGIIGLLITVRGFTMSSNWSSLSEPTLAGTIPEHRDIYDNYNGPISGGTSATRWLGSFNESKQPKAITLTDQTETTPSLLDSQLGRINTVIFNYVSAGTVTMFDDAEEGDELTLIFTDGNTTIGNTSGDNGINLVGGVDFVGTAIDTMQLKYIDSNGLSNRWLEISRSVI